MCGLGVAAVAVATDRVNVRMRHQPLLDGLRGVIIEHVDHGVPFQVHQDGAVGAPFALGPFIHADHLRLRAAVVGLAPCSTRRNNVSLLTGNPMRRVSRSPARPPSA
jgi:hypothetical protein